MASAWACIFSQSSTDSRTSRSTFWRRSSISAVSSSSARREISMCIHDSRSAPGSRGRVAPSSTGCTVWSSPVMSRTTSNCGWITTCTSRCWRASSMVSESTRNGMSSVITSTTEWPPALQPSALMLGVKTRTAAVPWGRCRASL